MPSPIYVENACRVMHNAYEAAARRITPKTQALANAALEEWELKKLKAGAGRGRRGRLNLSESNGQAGAEVSLQALMDRARLIEDPQQKLAARKMILDLATKPGGPPMKVRKKLASEGKAMPHGGFPIRNVEELKKAIRAIGRAKDPAKARRHIIRRARALGATNLIPEQWKIDLANEIANNVIDLALTKDGRKSFKNRGRWRHGYIPVDDAAVTAKAKGSPIARRRILRLYGSGANRRSTKPGAGTVRKDGSIKVKAASKGGSVVAKTAGQATGAKLAAARPSTKLTDPSIRREASKGGGAVRRVEKPWNEIPDAQKTVRNGKRYVVTSFAGKQQLSEWQGQAGPKTKDDKADQRYASISPATLAQFTPGELSRLLKVPGQPAAVRAAIRKQMRKLRKKEKSRG